MKGVVGEEREDREGVDSATKLRSYGTKSKKNLCQKTFAIRQLLQHSH